MLTEASFTTAKPGKQPKCPSAEEWTKKLCYIYTMDYYSATGTNEIMPLAATGMQLGIIIRGEERETQNHMISLICEI